MIDFVKFIVFGVETEDLLHNEYLDFEGKYSVKTGEELEGKEVKYYDLKFKILKDWIEVSGSLHKYFAHFSEAEFKDNHDDFCVTNLVQVLFDLKAKFGFDPNLCLLENVEFGVNLGFSELVRAELIKLFVSHQGEVFIPKHNQQCSQIMSECRHDHYSLKIYLKERKDHPSKVRVEVKYKKTQPLDEIKVRNNDLRIQVDRHSILTLAQLIERESIEFFERQLIRVVKESLIYSDNCLELTDNLDELRLISRVSNPKWWEGPAKELSSKKKKLMVRKFKDLTKGNFQIKDQFCEEIKRKIDKLKPNWDDFEIQFNSVMSVPSYHSNSKEDSPRFMGWLIDKLLYFYSYYFKWPFKNVNKS